MCSHLATALVTCCLSQIFGVCGHCCVTGREGEAEAEAKGGMTALKCGCGVEVMLL